MLPDEVDPENIHAELKDGILNVMLPKLERRKVTRSKSPNDDLCDAAGTASAAPAFSFGAAFAADRQSNLAPRRAASITA